ncbi:MAG: SMC family ATPase [Clostridia bacterium]|nr:SMC family ATPase [Clostridia bacterium]
MKPLKLKFKGINSFSDETEIDFAQLTKNGIFGIFGDTGSGKSTILDCINFALYGDVDRSEEKTDIINYRCDSLEISFTFEITDEGKRKTYIIERSLKKKSGVHKAMLYEICEDKNLCVADNASSVKSKIIGVLGLEAKDFRKCIALPQGEFAQFVKSQPAERIKLIERLFNLSKYGARLKEKLSEKEKEVQAIYSELSGKLSTYSNATQESLQNLKDTLATKKRDLIQLNEIIDKEKIDKEKTVKLFEKRKELDEALYRLKKLEELKGSMDAMRKSLNSIDGAKRIIECHNQIKKLSQDRLELDKKLSCAQNERNKISSSLESLKKLEESSNFDEKITQGTALLTELKFYLKDVIKLEEFQKELKSLTEKYKLESKLLLSDDENVKSLLNSLNKLNDEFESVKNISVEKFLSKFKDGVLKEEYSNQFSLFADLRSDIQTFNDDSDLYKYIKKRFTEQMEYLKGRLLVLHEKLNVSYDIETELKRLQEDIEKRDSINNKINEVNSQIIKLNASIEQHKGVLNEVKANGEKARSEYNSLKETLTKVFGADCINYEQKVREQEKANEKLKADKQTLTNEKLAYEGKLKQTEENIALINTEIAKNQTQIDSNKNLLTVELSNLNFSSVDDCENLVKEFEKYQNAKNTLDDFDSKYAQYTLTVKDLKEIDGINTISVDVVNEVKTHLAKFEENSKNLNAEIAVIEKSKKEAEERLLQKEALLKEFNSIEKQSNLIFQLKETLKGNKFLEFIANEYLIEISTLASSTLLKLTCGRYFLTYNESFFVGDNYDCGKLRGVNTLSGGETFLVSLSLALALSNAICAKSLKSIEFFFLDEGFGTLDETLIDTVMDALERLKSEQFTIGIISHVEELKHRIDSKIIVNKATESKGSTIYVSC